MRRMEDGLDQMNWQMMQDPMKQIFLSFSKALRVQAASLREVDRKCAALLSPDQVGRLIRESFDQVCTKQDATQLIYQLEAKVDQKDFNDLEDKVELMLQENRRLHGLLANQNQTIERLTAQLDDCCMEVNRLKTPNYDQVLSYVDRQMQNTLIDIEAKLSTKAEKREVETCLPQRVEDLYRNIYNKVADIHREVSHCATREELLELANVKADVGALRDLSAEMISRISRSDAQQIISAHIQPVLQLIKNQEKDRLTHVSTQKNSLDQITDRLATLQTVYQEISSSNLLGFLKENQISNLRLYTSKEYIVSLVQNAIQEKENSSRVEQIVEQHIEQVYKRLDILGQSLRLDSLTSCKEEIKESQSSLLERIEEVRQATVQTNEKLNKVRQSMKELSLNTAKAISEKVHKSHAVNRSRDISKGTTEQVLTVSQELLPPNDNMQDSLQEFEFLMSELRGENQNIEPNYEEGNQHQRGINSDASDKSEDERQTRPMTKRGGISGNILKEKQQLANRFRQSRGIMKDQQMQPTRTDALNVKGQLAAMKSELQRIEGIVSSIQNSLASTTKASPSNKDKEQLVVQEELSKIDCRLAITELGMNLRREMAEKMSREEVYTALQSEYAELEQRLSESERILGSHAKSQDVTRLSNDLISLKQRLTGELVAARFLWTSGRLLSSGAIKPSHLPVEMPLLGFVPWDVQAINMAPNAYLWKKGEDQIVVRLPGLYQLSCYMFTVEKVVMQLYLNDEPFVILQPRPAATLPVVLENGIGTADTLTTHKLSHSAGEVSSVGLQEYVSVPAEARIKVLLASNQPVQGFLSLRKL